MQPIFRTALGVSLIATAAASAAPVTLVDTAMDRGTRGHIIVDVEINGAGTFPFLVDTGAQGSVVFPSLVEALGLTPDSGAQVRVQGASEARDMSLYRLDSFQLGQVRVEDMPAVSGPEGAGSAFAPYTTYGIIGANILNQYSVEFDFEDSRMRFFEPDTEFADYIALEAESPYRLNRVGFAEFDVLIDEVAVTAILDLGASYNVVNAAGMTALTLDPDAETNSTAPLRGINGQQVNAPLAEGLTLRFGDRDFPATEVALMDSPVFGMLGHGDSPAMFLGLPLFQGRSLIFDRRAQSVLVGETDPV